MTNAEIQALFGKSNLIENEYWTLEFTPYPSEHTHFTFEDPSKEGTMVVYTGKPLFLMHRDLSMFVEQGRPVFNTFSSSTPVYSCHISDTINFESKKSISNQKGNIYINHVSHPFYLAVENKKIIWKRKDGTLDVKGIFNMQVSETVGCT